MDNYSVSSVRPLSPQMKNVLPRKMDKMLILGLIEAIVIIGLIIVLIVTNLPSTDDKISFEEFGEIVENNIDEYETNDLRLEESDKSAFMYLHAVASNAALKKNGLTSTICQTLSSVYKKSFPDDNLSPNLCLNGQLVVYSELTESKDYPFLELIKLSFISADKSYDYYIYTDFSAIEHIELSKPEESNEAVIIYDE